MPSGLSPELRWVDINADKFMAKKVFIWCCYFPIMVSSSLGVLFYVLKELAFHFKIESLRNHSTAGFPFFTTGSSLTISIYLDCSEQIDISSIMLFAGNPISDEWKILTFYEFHDCLRWLLELWKMKMRDFYVLFLRKAHNTEHPSRGCPHLVLISQLSRLKQCR